MKKLELIKIIKEEISEVIQEKTLQGSGMDLVKQIVKKFEQPGQFKGDADRFYHLSLAVKHLAVHLGESFPAEVPAEDP